MKAKFWKNVNNGVQCRLCSHFCILTEAGENSLGKCRVRKNVNNELISLVGNKIVSYNIDPIEKKPLYHFLPASPIFSIGSMGCNLNCAWCQNTGIAHPNNEVEAQKGSQVSPDILINTVLKHNCKSIAYTYNEPTVFFELMLESATLARQKGIKNVIVSNGFQSPESLEALLPWIDGANIDLKCFSNSTYQKFCNAKIQPVLNNLKTMSNKTWLEITTLIVPTVNDNEEELKELANFIAQEVGVNTPWHISAFHPCRNMLHLPRTGLDILLKAYEIGKNAGLNYVYVGNVAKMNKTLCPNCQTELLSRVTYKVEMTTDFSKGICPNCQNSISGYWN